MPVSDEGYQHIEHGFEPVFDERSRVLVLGSFPSVLSRANAFYYGNPQNRFWRVMAVCLGAPVPPNEGDSLASGEPATLDASVAAKRSMLLNGGVALWDVIESCDIKGSSDASSKTLCRHILNALWMPRRSRSLSATAARPDGSTNAIYKSGRGYPPSCCRRRVLPTRRGVWSGLSSVGVKPLTGQLINLDY